MPTDKFVSVRIRKDQFDAFMKVAEINYSSVNKLVQQAADNYIEDEAQVWIDSATATRKKLGRQMNR